MVYFRSYFQKFKSVIDWPLFGAGTHGGSAGQITCQNPSPYEQDVKEK